MGSTTAHWEQQGTTCRYHTATSSVFLNPKMMPWFPDRWWKADPNQKERVWCDTSKEKAIPKKAHVS